MLFLTFTDGNYVKKEKSEKSDVENKDDALLFLKQRKYTRCLYSGYIKLSQNPLHTLIESTLLKDHYKCWNKTEAAD